MLFLDEADRPAKHRKILIFRHESESAIEMARLQPNGF
jgi:hypothetical protein